MNNNQEIELRELEIPLEAPLKIKAKPRGMAMTKEKAIELQKKGVAARLERKKLKQVALLAPEKEAVLKIAPILFPNITKIVKDSGISRPTLFRWLNEDADFKKRFDEAVDEKIDEIEESLFLTAKKPQHASLTIPILKAFRKERWGDEKGVGSGSIVINIESPFKRPEAVEVVVEENKNISDAVSTDLIVKN